MSNVVESDRGELPPDLPSDLPPSFTPEPAYQPEDAGDATAAVLREAPVDAAALGWHQRLFRHIPAGQLVRYLGVGVFNTIFGFSTFALINYVLHRHHVPLSYLVATLPANLINITVAYLGYKHFVFRTRGNYLAEWTTAMAVYGSGLLPGLILLPVLVHLLNWLLPPVVAGFGHAVSRRELAPYLANALLLGVGVVYSFIGHKNVTFRASTPG